MSDKQNVFYTSISKYYSEIFPYNSQQLKFVQESFGELQNKRIMDIGCATGELAYQLANLGAKVTGIDLNEDLLGQAQSNKIHSGLSFQHRNMLNLKNDFQTEEFDAVLCFGNTLVHLHSFELIRQMLDGAIAVLKTGGKLFIQILNYDYILAKQISELPLIETDTIRFIRKYKFQHDSALIQFQTQLDMKAENTQVSNDTLLLALNSEELLKLLQDAGFNNIHYYSNFKKEAFGGKHLPLVISCQK